MEKGKIIKTIIAAIVIVVGVFVVVYNIVMAYNIDLKYLLYKNVEANVSTVQSIDIDGKEYYYANLNYNINGANYSVTSDYTEDVNKYSVDDKVIVSYNPKNPANYHIKSDEMYLSYYLYIFISSIVTIIAIKMFDKQFRG